MLIINLNKAWAGFIFSSINYKEINIKITNKIKKHKGRANVNKS